MFPTSDPVEFHEAAALFPMMEGDDFAELVSDIQDKGLLVPILLADGKIADGRNRYRACQKLGLKPRFVEWSGEGELLSEIVSLNLFRRHLTTSQRAMIGARIKPRFEAEAKQRQANSTGGAKPQLRANLHEAETGRSSKKAAEAVNVSPRMVDAATTVLEKGAPELVQAVENGQVKVSAAVEVVDLPKEEQAELVKQGPEAVKSKAAKARQARKTVPSQPVVILDDGPAFPPNGEPRSTKGWEVATAKIHEVILFVREQGGISGSIYGWTPSQVARLKDRLSYFQTHLTQWLDHIKGES